MLSTHLYIFTLNKSLISLLDKHAPESMITSDYIHSPDSSCRYTPTLHNNKRLLCKAEISYRNNSTPETLNNYKILKNTYRNDIITSKNACKHINISTKFQQFNNDSKCIHWLSSRLLVSRLKPPLPSGTPGDLHILFDAYFNVKLINIISSLATSDTLQHLTSVTTLLLNSYYHTNQLNLHLH